MLDWLIIGGGIHGTAISHTLRVRLRVPAAAVRVLDPYPQPLARWEATTHNTGMTYLRSPEVHHLHYDPWSIRTFAQTRRGQPHAAFIPLYNRPSLSFFREYSAWLIEKYGLDALRLTGRATGLTYHGDHWRVESDNGQIAARRVILAINTTESPHYPAWAQTAARLRHLFAPGFNRDDLPAWDHAVVVGGGISAAQTALTLAESGGAVTLLMRHETRLSHFDSDPCWVTRICLEAFHQQPDYDQRRQIITVARQRGSMPPDVAAALRAAVTAGRVNLMRGEVTACTATNDAVTLHLTDGATLSADQVILATGFDAARPGGAWLDAAIADYGLPVAACGYPVVGRDLCWHEGLYVVGRLSELEIGPVAGNIIGARLSGMRLLS